MLIMIKIKKKINHKKEMDIIQFNSNEKSLKIFQKYQTKVIKNNKINCFLN